MSSKSTIYYTSNGTHVYEETNEPRENGFNIYYTAFWREYNHVGMAGEPSDLKLVLVMSNMAEITFPLRDLFTIEIDAEGFSFGIRANTEAAEKAFRLKEVLPAV